MTTLPAPFQAVARRAPRLTWPQRVTTLAAALVISLVLVFLVMLAWSLWLSWLPDRDGPIPVWIQVDPSTP